ncbi:MAG: HpcH/HpaI aldolase/citrate lyase family protein [Burkholderiaceae bacterium]
MAGLHPEEVLAVTGGGDASGAARAHEPVCEPVCEHYAGDARKLAKALALQASRGFDFDVTMDLEDGAPAGAEADMVRTLVGLLNQWHTDRNGSGSVTGSQSLNESESGTGFWAGHRHAVGCRVHPREHPAFADDLHVLAHALEFPLAYLTIPKTEGVADATAAIAHAAQTFASANKQLPPVQLLVETHGAVREAFGLAALPEVRFLSFGQMDFTSAHHGAISAEAMHSPGQFDHPLLRRAKVEILAACHAAGKIPTHNPTVNFADSDQTRADAQQARSMGFLRMWSIHPSQVGPIVDSFAPSGDEVEAAAALLLNAQASQWGPIAFGGKLHDRASYRYFWALLKKARAMHRPIPQAAETAFF